MRLWVRVLLLNLPSATENPGGSAIPFAGAGQMLDSVPHLLLLCVLLICSALET